MTDESTCFIYRDGKTRASYYDGDFVPVFEPDCTGLSDVEQVCQGSEQCRYDYCVTMDRSVALNTYSLQVEFADAIVELGQSELRKCFLYMKRYVQACVIMTHWL